MWEGGPGGLRGCCSEARKWHCYAFLRSVLEGLKRPLLRSSAHWLWAPATCETFSSTAWLDDQEARRPRKAESGQLVESSLLMPASVGVLSLSEGMHMERCEVACLSLADMAKASWASVSKQAMYFWASLERKGQNWRTSCCTLRRTRRGCAWW